MEHTQPLRSRESQGSAPAARLVRPSFGLSASGRTSLTTARRTVVQHRQLRSGVVTDCRRTRLTVHRISVSHSTPRPYSRARCCGFTVDAFPQGRTLACSSSATVLLCRAHASKWQHLDPSRHVLRRGQFHREDALRRTHGFDDSGSIEIQLWTINQGYLYGHSSLEHALSVRHDAPHNIMVPIGLTVAVANA